MPILVLTVCNLVTPRAQTIHFIQLFLRNFWASVSNITLFPYCNYKVEDIILRLLFGAKKRNLFLVYINDLSNGLKSNPKLFADDTSLFSVIHDVNSSQIDLNEDLDKINNWAYQW